MPALTSRRPAEPFADAKARLAAAVEAARGEILDLSHRIHANPEPAFEEVQAATWVAEVLRAPRVRGGAPGRQPRAPRSAPIRRGGRGGTSPRIGILAEYDALPGLGHGCGHNTMAASGRRRRHRARLAGRRAAGRDRLPRDAGRGARQRQADHDRRRPVRRDRRGAAVPPVRSQPRREPPARVGGRRRHLHRPAVPCLVGPVAGQERARRPDQPVRHASGCGASSCARPPASTASSARAARPPTSSPTGPRPGS